MSQKLLQQKKRSLSPISHDKSPPLLSPKPKIKQVNPFIHQHTYQYPPIQKYIVQQHQPLQSLNSTQNIIKNLQNQPLQFSANRKIKAKYPQLYFQGVSNNNCNNNPSVNNNNYYSNNSRHQKINSYEIQNNNNASQNYIQSNINNNNINPNNTNVNNINQNNNNNKYINQNTYQPINLNLNLNLNKIKSSSRQKQKQIQNYRIKFNLQNQIKAIIDGKKNMQDQFENKCKHLEEQRNYWMQNYLQLRQQYQILIKNKQNESTLPHLLTNKLQSQLYEVKQQLQQNKKSLKSAQDKIYLLNKQKADLDYQLSFYREQSRKANSKIFQLQYQIENEKKELKQLQQKINTLKEQANLNSSLSSSITINSGNMNKSMDVNQQSKLDGLTLSFDNNSNSIHNNRSFDGQLSTSPSHKSRSSSSNKSLSSSGSKHKGSKHHRSSSHHSLTSSHSNSHNNPHNHNHRHTNINSQNIPLQLQQINFDLSKQLQRNRHAYRKLQKTVTNQNSEAMAQGLKRLNNKYAKMFQDQELYQLGNKQLSSNQANTSLNTYNNQRHTNANPNSINSNNLTYININNSSNNLQVKNIGFKFPTVLQDKFIKIVKPL